MFNLLLFDSNFHVCTAFKLNFLDVPNVHVRHSTLEDLDIPYDCLVSPANSFGMMTGGIDKAIVEKFGQQLMDRVQNMIIDKYAGEQPVGTSMIVNSGNKDCVYLAHTPTMKFPMKITDTDNVYYAMKAMLLAVEEFNSHIFVDSYKIKNVACSGLGTFIGGVDPMIAAKQMRLAYDHFMNRPEKIDWEFAYERHEELMNSMKIRD